MMAKRPDMILQFAHYLAERWKPDKGIGNVAVRVVSKVSRNGREYAPMIDRKVDLAKQQRNLKHTQWICAWISRWSGLKKKFVSILGGSKVE
jgi:vitamin K-dependent gamma-carboxylase